MARDGDWRDSERYAALRHCDGAGLAWEWLRRDPDYRADYARALGGASAPRDGTCPAIRHGLVDFEDPDLAVPQARPLWHRSLDPYVLMVDADDEGPVHDRFAIDAVGPLATMRACRCGMQHLLLSDGWRHLRLDLVGTSLGDGPARLHYQIAGFASAGRHALTLQRLLTFHKSRRLVPLRPLTPYSLSHRINELRVSDALGDCASYQEIARALFGHLAPLIDWRIGPIRSRVRRLSKAAQMMQAGGWRRLLL